MLRCQVSADAEILSEAPARCITSQLRVAAAIDAVERDPTSADEDMSTLRDAPLDGSERERAMEDRIIACLEELSSSAMLKTLDLMRSR